MLSYSGCIVLFHEITPRRQKMSDKPALIKFSEITAYETKLRDVEKETADYKELVASIATDGLINAICVCVAPDELKAEGKKYILVDGLHRLNACQDAGMDTIPAIVKPKMDKNQILVGQLVANSHKIDTKPAQMAAQLLRISNANKMMTRTDLANMIHRSTTFVDNYLKLTVIEDEKIMQMIDDGDICVTNASALASLWKVAPDEVPNFIQQAVTNQASEFVPVIEARVKEINAEKRKGKGKGEAEFKHIPKLRKPKEVIALLEDSTSLVAAAATEEISSVEDAINFTLRFVLNSTTKDVEVAREAWEAAKKSRVEARAKGKAERDLKKAAEQNAKAAEAHAAALAFVDGTGPDPAIAVAAAKAEAAEAAAKVAAETDTNAEAVSE